MVYIYIYIIIYYTFGGFQKYLDKKKSSDIASVLWYIDKSAVINLQKKTYQRLVGGLERVLFSHLYWVSNHPN